METKLNEQIHWWPPLLYKNEQTGIALSIETIRQRNVRQKPIMTTYPRNSFTTKSNI